MDTPDLQANADRFARDAELYDAVRPTPPDDLAALLVRYAGADAAWDVARRTVRVFEHRLAERRTGAALHGPVDLDGPEAPAELLTHTPADTHVRRTTAPGVRSWSKTGHLARLVESGRFAWCHEVACHRIDASPASRFVDLLRSQGDYQTLRAAGLSDDELGATRLAAAAAVAWRGQPTRPVLFTYRVRVGVRPG